AAAFLAQPGRGVGGAGPHRERAAMPAAARHLARHRCGGPHAEQQQPAVASGLVAGAALIAALSLLTGAAGRSRGATSTCAICEIKRPAGPGMKRDIGLWEFPGYQENTSI
ncbi:unnamed protein product, partial [Prorocentrum cordatum]